MEGMDKGTMKHRALTMVLLLALTGLGFGGVARAAGTSGATSPDWAHNPRLDAAGDLAARIAAGAQLNASPSSSNQGTPCAAEPSTTGNVQVNCRSEDGGSA